MIVSERMSEDKKIYLTLLDRDCEQGAQVGYLGRQKSLECLFPDISMQEKQEWEAH